MSYFQSSFFKSIFSHHHFNIVNKFSPGDVCLWPHECDSCMDSVVEILDWARVYNKKTNHEYIVYTFEDIYRGYKYDFVEEKYLTLLASHDEMVESMSPYEYKFSNNN